jgi:hypothetical protein
MYSLINDYIQVIRRGKISKDLVVIIDLYKLKKYKEEGRSLQNKIKGDLEKILEKLIEEGIRININTIFLYKERKEMEIQVRYTRKGEYMLYIGYYFLVESKKKYPSVIIKFFDDMEELRKYVKEAINVFYQYLIKNIS